VTNFVFSIFEEGKDLKCAIVVVVSFFTISFAVFVSFERFIISFFLLFFRSKLEDDEALLEGSKRCLDDEDDDEDGDGDVNKSTPPVGEVGEEDEKTDGFIE
jgi:hypothetical protein